MNWSGHHSSAAESQRARVLIVSMRNLTAHVSRCATYEFEDTIRACDAVDLLSPMRVSYRRGSQPERIQRIRRDNIVNSLLRHDWIYRWRQMLDIVGLAPSEGMGVREAHLKRLAAVVALLGGL